MTTSGRASVHVKAPGKINVFLKVGALDDEGYHDVAIAYQAVSLCEDVRVSDASDFSVEVSGPVELSRVPLDGSNIAIRAARLLAARTGYPGGARIRIDKHVPVTGGMGGVGGATSPPGSWTGKKGNSQSSCRSRRPSPLRSAFVKAVSGSGKPPQLWAGGGDQ